MESVSTILTTARQYNKLERYYMTSRVKIKGGWGWTHPGRQRTPTANTGQKVWGRVSTPPPWTLHLSMLLEISTTTQHQSRKWELNRHDERNAAQCPVFCFYKSNPVCKHFNVCFSFGSCISAMHFYYSIIFVFFILFYNMFHSRLLFQ